jgi:hypothetical protein
MTAPARVVIAGNYYADDIALVNRERQVEFVQTPFMQELTSRELAAEFIARIRSADLVIFRLVGDDPEAFIRRLDHFGLLPEFEAVPAIKALWSQDSHHMHSLEAAALPWFDRIYVAHYQYLDLFPASKTQYLPCAFTAASVATLVKLNADVRPIERDIIFPHVMYGGAERNRITFHIAERLRQRGVSSLMGRLYGSAAGIPYGNLLYGLSTSRVVLNISLSDDLNIRNFEAVAMNRTLLTNEVPDHQLQNLDYRRTYFFRRDLSDLDSALDAALADSGTTPVWRSVPGRNMLIDRYLTIINRELGTELRVVLPDLEPGAVSSVLPRQVDFALEPDVILYDNSYLLVHALAAAVTQGHWRDAIRLVPRFVRYPRALLRLLTESYGALHRRTRRAVSRGSP